MKSDAYLISCEHGGNRVPAVYAPLFGRSRALLSSHRGYDAGALAMAREMSAALQAPLFAATTTRLLVDLNRSIGHPGLYSEITRDLSATERREILERWYRPHRLAIETEVAQLAAQGRRVAHIASHSFVPVLEGETRNADIGLLYDPARSDEAEFCARWRELLLRGEPGLCVRRNYPYRGAADGLTAYLRKRYGERQYLGVELELNQKHVRARAGEWRAMRRLVSETLVQLRDMEMRRSG